MFCFSTLPPCPLPSFSEKGFFFINSGCVNEYYSLHNVCAKVESNQNHCRTGIACITCPTAPTLLHTPSWARVQPSQPSSPSQPGVCLDQSEVRRENFDQWERGWLTLPCSWQDGARPVGGPCFEGVVMHTFVLTNMSMVMLARVNIAFKDPGQVWTTRPAFDSSTVHCWLWGGVGAQLEHEQWTPLWFWKFLTSADLQIEIGSRKLTLSCFLRQIQWP